MTRKRITAKQHEFLQFLINHVEETGKWPTYQEMMDHFGYRSPNSVTQNLTALRKKGHLRRDERGYRLAPKHEPTPDGIPVKGIISAGTLQEAVEANLGTITLDYIFPDLDQIYALRVSGASMEGAGIQDGDYVLLIDEDISDGEIGAVLYKEETSLKRVYRDPEGGVRLEPANPAFDNIYIETDDVEEVTLLGRYVGHVNREKGIYTRYAPQ